MAQIGLFVAFDEEIGFWYFVAERVYDAGETELGFPGTEVLHFRPGFRTEEQALEVGEAWIKENFNVTPKDSRDL